MLASPSYNVLLGRGTEKGQAMSLVLFWWLKGGCSDKSLDCSISHPALNLSAYSKEAKRSYNVSLVSTLTDKNIFFYSYKMSSFHWAHAQWANRMLTWYLPTLCPGNWEISQSHLDIFLRITTKIGDNWGTHGNTAYSRPNICSNPRYSWVTYFILSNFCNFTQLVLSTHPLLFYPFLSYYQTYVVLSNCLGVLSCARSLRQYTFLTHQASLAIVPFWYGGSRHGWGFLLEQPDTFTFYACKMCAQNAHI